MTETERADEAADRPAAADERLLHAAGIAREFLSAALYLAIVLLAALAAVPRDRLPDDGDVVTTVLGTSLGLILAHWLAFRLATHVTSKGGRRARVAALEAGAQVAGGLAVAVLASLPFLLLEGEAAVTTALVLLALLPPLTGAAVARIRGGSWLSSVGLAAAVLVVTAVVVAVKVATEH